MRTLRLLTATLGTAVLAGCSHGAPEEPVPLTAKTQLEVRNDNFNDMRIYVIRGSQRSRIGTVNGKSTATFALAPSLVLGITRLRFEAVPIGGRVATFSEEIPVNQGETIILQITP